MSTSGDLESFLTIHGGHEEADFIDRSYVKRVSAFPVEPGGEVPSFSGYRRRL